MHTRGGMLATKAMVRPQSSGCSILACSASVGTTGRSFRIGVATSPGEKQQARRAVDAFVHVEGMGQRLQPHAWSWCRPGPGIFET